MIANRQSLVSWIAVIAAAAGTAWLLQHTGSDLLLRLFVLAAFSLLTLRANETLLPLLVILTLALGSLYRLDIASKSFYLRFCLLGLVAVRAWLLYFGTLRSGLRVEIHPVTPLHASFLVAAVFGLVTSIISVDPTLSFLRAFSFFLLYVAVFVYFWLRSDTAERCMKYGASLWTALLILLAAGFLLYPVAGESMFRGGRLGLIFGNPNTLGHYCAIMAPIAVWMLFEKVRGHRRILTWGVAGTVMFCLIASGSRGALVAAFPALILQFLLCYRKKLAFMVLAVAFIGSAQFLMDAPDPGITESPSFVEEYVLRPQSLATGSGRSEVWNAAYNLARQRPIWGYGFGVVDRLFVLGYFPDAEGFQGGHIHNGYLEELVNLGWLGAAPIFLALLYTLVLGFAKTARPRRVTSNYRFSVSLLSLVAAGCLSGISESWFTSVGSVFCFPYWLGAMLLVRITLHLRDWDAEGAN